jgi:hypothetical protein
MKKMMKLKSSAPKWALILLCCASLWTCRSTAPTTHHVGALTGKEKVLVLPFQNMAWLHGSDVNVRNPLTGKVFMTGPVAEGVDRLFTDMLVEALNEKTGFQTVPSKEAHAILEALKASGTDARDEPLRILSQTGRMLNADLVIQGYVYRYKDRVGRNYSAESAASVAFDVYFIDCADQELAWSGYFDETQQALTDDLRLIGTFFRRKARWITAEEMAKDAMDAMFEEFEQP